MSISSDYWQSSFLGDPDFRITCYRCMQIKKPAVQFKRPTHQGYLCYECSQKDTSPLIRMLGRNSLFNDKRYPDHPAESAWAKRQRVGRAHQSGDTLQDRLLQGSLLDVWITTKQLHDQLPEDRSLKYLSTVLKELYEHGYIDRQKTSKGYQYKKK